jgi:hypothetical protein
VALIDRFALALNLRCMPSVRSERETINPFTAPEENAKTAHPRKMLGK